jgi:hypothetical protein
MANGWSTKRVLITVRTYPVPAHRGIEVSCTAGVTSDGKWIRLFPIPYRFLAPDQRFTKYQWIDVSVISPRGDPRPESYTLRIDSIQRRETVGTADNWRARKHIIFPLRRNSLCQIAAERQNGGPTLGIFRPAQIKRLVITPAKPPNWTPRQEALLRQQLLGFETTPRTPLEKIPLDSIRVPVYRSSLSRSQNDVHRLGDGRIISQVARPIRRPLGGYVPATVRARNDRPKRHAFLRRQHPPASR